MRERTQIALILGGVAVAMAVYGLWFFKSEAASHDAAATPTKVLVRALEAGKPSAAPPGAEGYVKGIREHFGRVRRARFLDAYTKRTGSHRQATTEVVSEILVRAKRGAGVLQLGFDDDEIVDIDELRPSAVHSDLDPEAEADVKRGFARRGGETASSLVLDGTFKRDR